MKRVQLLNPDSSRERVCPRDFQFLLRPSLIKKWASHLVKRGTLRKKMVSNWYQLPIPNPRPPRKPQTMRINHQRLETKKQQPYRTHSQTSQRNPLTKQQLFATKIPAKRLDESRLLLIHNHRMHSMKVRASYCKNQKNENLDLSLQKWSWTTSNRMRVGRSLDLFKRYMRILYLNLIIQHTNKRCSHLVRVSSMWQTIWITIEQRFIFLIQTSCGTKRIRQIERNWCAAFRVRLSCQQDATRQTFRTYPQLIKISKLPAMLCGDTFSRNHRWR